MRRGRITEMRLRTLPRARQEGDLLRTTSGKARLCGMFLLTAPSESRSLNGLRARVRINASSSQRPCFSFRGREAANVDGGFYRTIETLVDRQHIQRAAIFAE